MKPSMIAQVKTRLAAGETAEHIMAGMSASDWECYREEVMGGPFSATRRELHEEFGAETKQEMRRKGRRILRRHGCGRAHLSISIEASRVDAHLLIPGPFRYRCVLDVFPDEGYALLAYWGEQRRRGP
ncbi:MAG: hypothetical protein ABSD48_17915 [Armatimonadota bacterium]